MGLGDRIFELVKSTVELHKDLDALQRNVERLNDDVRTMDRRLVRVETLLQLASAKGGVTIPRLTDLE